MRTAFSIFTASTSLLVCSINLVHSAEYVFTTISGSPGLTGSAGGTNRSARYFGPHGICVDASGRLFVTEPMVQTIRMVTPLGTDWVASTIAGTYGVSGGADGTNNQAQFVFPSDIAVDGAGNVYVTDNGNHTIRKLLPIGTDWVVTTIAGLASVKGSANGTNSDARFSSPSGIAVDKDSSLYVADSGNHTIRKLTQVGTDWVVSTIAGQPGVRGHIDGSATTARLSSPTGIAVDSNGNVYFSNSHTVRRITPQGASWTVTTIAGMNNESGSTDGTNQQARFFDPRGLAADQSGVLYLSDALNNTIRKVIPYGSDYVTTTIGGVAGAYGTVDGAGDAARFAYARGIAVDSEGRLFISDNHSQCIRQGVADGTPPGNLYPVAQCDVVFVFADTNGLANASVGGGSFDPDGDPITVTVSPPGPYPLGTNWVDVTVTDAKGAASSCLAVVNVLDPTPPQITAPAPQAAIQVNARTGQVVIVQVSTNLVNWTSIQTNTFGQGSTAFHTHTNYSQRGFYRLKLWP